MNKKFVVSKENLDNWKIDKESKKNLDNLSKNFFKTKIGKICLGAGIAAAIGLTTVGLSIKDNTPVSSILYYAIYQNDPVVVEEMKTDEEYRDLFTGQRYPIAEIDELQQVYGVISFSAAEQLKAYEKEKDDLIKHNGDEARLVEIYTFENKIKEMLYDYAEENNYLEDNYYVDVEESTDSKATDNNSNSSQETQYNGEDLSGNNQVNMPDTSQIQDDYQQWLQRQAQEEEEKTYSK